MKHPKSCSKYEVDFANEPFEFEVSAKDVKGSRVADTENCAAACALKQLPDVIGAWVTRTRTVLKRADGTMLRYENPRPLKRAVEKFDDTAGNFPPGVYKLHPVTPSQRERTPTDKRNKSGRGKRPALKRKRPSYALR